MALRTATSRAFPSRPRKMPRRIRRKRRRRSSIEHRTEKIEREKIEHAARTTTRPHTSHRRGLGRAQFRKPAARALTRATRPARAVRLNRSITSKLRNRRRSLDRERHPQFLHRTVFVAQVAVRRYTAVRIASGGPPAGDLEMIERKSVQIHELSVLINGRLPVAVVEFYLHCLAFQRKLAFHGSTPLCYRTMTVCAAP